MLLIFLSLLYSSKHQHHQHYQSHHHHHHRHHHKHYYFSQIEEENGFFDKLKKVWDDYVKPIGKKIAEEIKHHVIEPLSELTKRTVTEISKFIKHDTHSEFVNPIKISKIEMESHNYRKEIPFSGINQYLKKELGIPTDNIKDFIQQLEFCDSKKRRVCVFGMDINKKDKRYRTARAGVFDILAYWNDDQVVVETKSKTGKTTVYADTTKTTSTSELGGLIKHEEKKSEWRPLTADELTEINQILRDEIDKKLK